MSNLNGFNTYPTNNRDYYIASGWNESRTEEEVCEIHPPTLWGKITNFFHNWISSFLTRILPRKTKRLFFVASLIASIKGIKDPDDFILTAINNKFYLSNSQEALALPIWMGVNLWYGRVPKNLCLKCVGNEPLINLAELNGKRLTANEMRIAANSVINCAPDWIKYGSRRVMRNDFVAILEFIQG